MRSRLLRGCLRPPCTSAWVTPVVIDEAAGDRGLKISFAIVDMKRVKRLLVEQVCSLSGGGCICSGDWIHEVDAGFGVTQTEFYGLAQILNDAMVRPGPAIRGNELLALLSPMKRDVVEC
jgi:hemoglobin